MPDYTRIRQTEGNLGREKDAWRMTHFGVQDQTGTRADVLTGDKIKVRSSPRGARGQLPTRVALTLARASR